MPKIPIDFAYGDYEDAAPAVENRRVLNCYPETTPGDNARTIVRGVEGYNVAGSSVFTGRWIQTLETNNKLFHLINDGGVLKLYDGISLAKTYATAGDVKFAKMASNGKFIVILVITLNGGSATSSNDQYYDLSTFGIGGQMIVKDANWAGFGKAADVTFSDGYFVFTTTETIFHGDNVATGDGLTFNPLSFTTPPAEAGILSGVERANSQVYVFSQNRAFIYAVSPTVPFSFQLNKSFSVNINNLSYLTKISIGDSIYCIGSTDFTQVLGFYEISGSQVIQLKTFNGAINAVTANPMYSYSINKHSFVGFTYKEQGFQTEEDIAYCLDITESRMRGYPVWHRRGMVLDADNDSVVNGSYPIVSYVNNNNLSNVVQAIGLNLDTDTTTLYNVLENSSLNEASFFDIDPVEVRVFEYSFPIIRNDSEPLFIKSISLGFNDNVATAELMQSIDGENYTSLGEFDLTTITSHRAEWRRLGRYETDVVFKVRTTTVEETKPMTIIDGYYMT